MSRPANSIPSFRSLPIPTDPVPRRYRDAPTTVARSGYVLEWCPTHPKATHGVYFQHRLVMECSLGRFLNPGEVVHHISRDRTDNRLENLSLSANHSDHMRQHWAGRGKNDPKLIAAVLEAAADPTKDLASLGVSPTMVKTICRENGITWIPCGQRGHTRLITEHRCVKHYGDGQRFKPPPISGFAQPPSTIDSLTF
jgi:HNH endonuclease